MTRIIAALMVFISTASIALAEPTPGVRYLMDKPVSLFDWGVHHIDEHLKDMHITFFLDSGETEFKTDRLKTSVDYDPDANRIYIESNPGGVSFVMGDEKAARKLCGEIVKKIRVELDMDAENPSVTGTAVDKFFSHSGYSLPDKPAGLAKELLGIIEIKTTLQYWAESDSAKVRAPQISCRTPLLSKRAYYSD